MCCVLCALVRRFGAQYIMGSMASTNPAVPASGLYGPWVTSDAPEWNGDYTVSTDPNFKSSVVRVQQASDSLVVADDNTMNTPMIMVMMITIVRALASGWV